MRKYDIVAMIGLCFMIFVIGGCQFDSSDSKQPLTSAEIDEFNSFHTQENTSNTPIRLRQDWKSRAAILTGQP